MFKRGHVAGWYLQVLGTVAEELLAANGLYRSRCAEAEAHVQALQVLNQGKSEVERQQAERIQNLEAELDNVPLPPQKV